MVGAATRLDGDERRRKLLEVSDHLRPPELATDDHCLALVDAETFLPVEVLGAGPAVLAVAADLGGTRLIDNVLVESVVIDPVSIDPVLIDPVPADRSV